MWRAWHNISWRGIAAAYSVVKAWRDAYGGAYRGMARQRNQPPAALAHRGIAHARRMALGDGSDRWQRRGVVRWAIRTTR